jgi:large subunit ribosomal protein L30
MAKAKASQLTITQLKSTNGANPKQRDTLRTLGLGKIGRSVERPDEPTVRGAIQVVRHLVKVDDA